MIPPHALQSELSEPEEVEESEDLKKSPVRAVDDEEMEALGEDPSEKEDEPEEKLSSQKDDES